MGNFPDYLEFCTEMADFVSALLADMGKERNEGGLAPNTGPAVNGQMQRQGGGGHGADCDEMHER
jgi:hypothetical protein